MLPLSAAENRKPESPFWPPGTREDTPFCLLPSPSSTFFLSGIVITPEKRRPARTATFNYTGDNFGIPFSGGYELIAQVLCGELSLTRAACPLRCYVSQRL